jgi:hypothetical protein
VDVLLLEDRSTEVEFYPPERPASATCVFRSPSGTSLSTPSVTVDTLSRTVSSVNADDPGLVTVTGATGSLVESRYYWHVPATTGAAEDLVRLSELVASNTAAVDDPPPGGFVVGDGLRGARLTATIPLAATATRDVNYRIEWTVTGADGKVRKYTQLAHVVATLYSAAVTPALARQHLSDAWPGQVDRYRRGFFVTLADRAWARVWRRIRAAGRYQHLLGDPNDFTAAGRIALDIELMTYQLIPATVIDRSQYRAELEAMLQREIDDTIGSRPYDEKDSGDLSDTSLARPITAISARRV